MIVATLGSGRGAGSRGSRPPPGRGRRPKGVAELDAGAAPLGRVRRVGAGRKRATESDPILAAALAGLVEPGQRGDPMSPLRWTTISGGASRIHVFTRQGRPPGAASAWSE